MPLFLYRARDKNGQLQSGQEEAADASSLTSRLEEKGWLPVKIEEKTSTADFFEKYLPFLGGPRGRDLIIFTRQLCAMLGAGVTLLASLKSLERQTQNPVLKKTITSLQNDIQNGLSFSGALKKHPRIFPEYYIEMIVAGEISGALKEILDRLTSLLENEEVTKSRIIMATRYPTLVVIVIVMAFIFMLNFVIPKFTTLFSQINQKLPLPTRILLGAANISQKYWLLILIGAVGLFFLYRRYASTENGGEAIDRVKLKFPVFGMLFTKIITARITQILGVMIKSGITINQALTVVSHAAGNKVFEKALKNVQESVVGGSPLSEPIRKSELFPPVVVQMIAVGEESGELELMLDQIVNFYQLEIDYTIKNLVTLLEPFLIVMLAGVVLLLALGIFLPMWNLLEVYSKGSF